MVQQNDQETTQRTRQYVLFWSVLALTLFLILRALGKLLADVQYAAGNTFGGMEVIASGLRLDVVARTNALLDVWRAAAEFPRTHDLISAIAIAYNVVDSLFIVAYSALLITIWRRLRSPKRRGDPATSIVRVMRAEQLRELTQWRYWWVFVIAAAMFDAVENVCRSTLVEAAIADRPVGDWLIWTSWSFTTGKFLMLGFCAASLLAAWLGSTTSRTEWTKMRWTLWRLRVAVVAVAVYSGLLLIDPTGQALDLVRRWLDNGQTLLSAVLAVLAAGLLAAAVWVITNRVVLGKTPVTHQPERWYTSWLLWLAVIAAAAVLARVLLHWKEIAIFAVVAGAIWVLTLLSLLLRHVEASIVGKLDSTAAQRRSDDADEARHPATVVEAARTLAVWPLATLLMVTAVAYAPVPLVLRLSEQESARFWVACALGAVGLCAAPFVAVGGPVVNRWLASRQRPRQNRWSWRARHVLTGMVILGVSAAAVLGAIYHIPGVGALVVLPAFLAVIVFVLGEAQRWSESYRPPSGLLLLGLTRVPTSALMAVLLVGAAYVFSDGSSHAVHRRGTLPTGFVSTDGLLRTGVNLETAFDAWVRGNCAGDGNTGRQVPLVLVAAPGGGLRAAYWTASVLTDIFGPTRDDKISGCPAAAPSDRIFAVGGASGGSLGLSAYIAGVDRPRGPAWYDEQLAKPDFLADPLAWMVSVDFTRGYVGFLGEDRARRLETSWENHISGLGGDFFAATWGVGGQRPLMLLTGTRAESGCRMNLGGLRLTNAWAHIDESTCTAARYGTGQSDPAATSDLLDSLCGVHAGSRPESLSYATAALLSARFPYVSPSGQLYGCDRPGEANAVPTAIVDGGYAENTGVGTLLDLWPKLEPLIAKHNAQTVEHLGADPAARNAVVVPFLVEVDNHYAQVAAPTEPAATIELLIPPSTKNRPDRLDDAVMEARAAATFQGPVPGTQVPGTLNSESGRYLKISPHTSPGLPAPLAWTLSRLATDDLAAQRTEALQKPTVQELCARIRTPRQTPASAPADGAAMLKCRA